MAAAAHGMWSVVGVAGAALLYHYQFVLPASEPYALGILRDIRAVLAVDALYERLLVVAGLALVVEHEVKACLVEGHGVGGGPGMESSTARNSSAASL